jgi:hypothetical protein
MITTTTAIATADINNPQSAPSALYTDDDPVVPSTTGPLNPVPPLPLGVPVQPHRVQQLYNHQNSFTQVESDLGNSQGPSAHEDEQFGCSQQATATAQTQTEDTRHHDSQGRIERSHIALPLHQYDTNVEGSRERSPVVVEMQRQSRTPSGAQSEVVRCAEAEAEAEAEAGSEAENIAARERTALQEEDEALDEQVFYEMLESSRSGTYHRHCHRLSNPMTDVPRYEREFYCKSK